ncbi:hypothetical protein BZA77DRAFT_304940 [Pyronema omphalodes]|nr:hypothetical protein BZA77DRAFT_304940 [Pyronema omphalodes]
MRFNELWLYCLPGLADLQTLCHSILQSRHHRSLEDKSISLVRLSCHPIPKNSSPENFFSLRVDPHSVYIQDVCGVHGVPATFYC